MKMKKTAVLLDGGHVRVNARKAGLSYNPDYIEKIAHACIAPGEELFRVLYYDCAPFEGSATLPVSGKKQQFSGSDQWLHELADKDYFAVRLGKLKFRGFIPQKAPIVGQPKDTDFKPSFEQKGVDMRIGLDMAIFASSRAVDLIALFTNDTDCIPAMKHARRSGIQVALVVCPTCKPSSELLAHADFRRVIVWPAP